MQKQLIEIVPPLPQEIAKKAFEQWRIANRKVADGMSAEDIIIDWIRAGEGKTLVRYRVALSESGEDGEDCVGTQVPIVHEINVPTTTKKRPAKEVAHEIHTEPEESP